jgi:outer membrane protein assembly factor BamB
MKLQCSCGAKYTFEVTPEMAQNPVRFVCPACGADSSDFVNNMVRRELGLAEAPAAPPPEPVAAAQPAPAAAPMRVRLNTPAPAAPAPEEADAPQRCPKHPEQFVVEKCHVCSKPICPKCMALFGYVCSPLCKGKAEAQGIAVPVFAGQKSVMQARAWRKTVWMLTASGALAAALVGGWIWWTWIGRLPKVIYSVKFPERAYSGESAFCGKDQLVFLRGGTLARHDMKLKKELWSNYLVDKKEIEDAVVKEMKDMQVIIDKANSERPDHVPKMPNAEELKKDMTRAAEESLSLRVHGENIWVLGRGKLTRYDRDTGKALKEIPVPAGFGGLIPNGDELLELTMEVGGPVVTRVNLQTCESRTETVASLAPPPKPDPNVALKKVADKAGLPLTPGKDIGKPMDPKKVAQQVQNLSYPARIALPAILAHNMNQNRTLAAYDDETPNGAPGPSDPESAANEMLVPTKEGFMRYSVKLLERRISSQVAMKAASSKSVLDGNVTAGQSLELAQEMLNQNQREMGRDTIRIDESRYQVTLRQPDLADNWTGEMIGPPALYPLATVNVLTANKSITVLDKTNKMRWQGVLSYNVSGSGRMTDEESTYGQGPVVERKDTLYVFDEGVLTAFDLAKGNVRWRLPSVGIMGLFFDDQDNLYVNTTTASPDSLKYRNQIDITRKDNDVAMKIDTQTGKILWRTDLLGGLINYVSGNYLFAVHSYRADTDENSGPYTADSVSGRTSFLSIKRINPKTGKAMWEYTDDRSPLEIRFNGNIIRLVYRKEVQVLRFMTF